MGKRKPRQFVVLMKDPGGCVVESLEIPRNPLDTEMARVTQFIRNMIEDGLECQVVVEADKGE